MRGKREKQPPKVSNIVLVVLAVFLLAFIATMIITFWVKGSVPDTLIQYTMGAGGVESIALAAIKIVKVHSGSAGESEETHGEDQLEAETDEP